MKHIVVKIDWYGPYKNMAEAKGAAQSDFDDGLYLAIGSLKNKKKNKIRYVGLSKNLAGRVSNTHETLSKLVEPYEIWLGEVGSTGIAGPKTQTTDLHLDLAEWCHVYFIDPYLNDKKRYSPPKKPVTVINHWWEKDYESLLKKRPHKDWPDVIDFLGKEYGAKVVWFGGECDRWKPKHFKNL